MYQSYLRLIAYRFQIELLLLLYKFYSFLLLFWIQWYLRRYSNLPNVSNSGSLLLKSEIYLMHIMYSKKFIFEVFNAEKLHSRVQTSIFSFFFLIKGWNIFYI